MPVKKEGKRTGAGRRLTALFLAALLFCGLPGCGKETKVVLTTGLAEDEVFRIEGISCTLPEVMLYLTNVQKQYESVYGSQIWEEDGQGGSLQEEVKEQVLGELAQVKSMALLAQRKGIDLQEEQKEQLAAAAREYCASLNEKEKQLLHAKEDLVAQMYREYALAQAVYRQIVSDVSPEISDDEARIITVQMIRLSDRDKAEAVLEKAREQETGFEALAEENSEDETVSCSFGKGEMDPAIEQAAFELGKDEISDIVEASGSFYILRCTSTFDEARTQENKGKILERLQNEAFEQEYRAFTDSLARQLNEPLWASVEMLHDDAVSTDSFFAVYDKYLGAS